MNVGANTVSDLPDEAFAVGHLQRFLRIRELPAVVSVAAAFAPSGEHTGVT